VQFRWVSASDDKPASTDAGLAGTIHSVQRMFPLACSASTLPITTDYDTNFFQRFASVINYGTMAAQNGG
jgi:hypothetical protein